MAREMTDQDEAAALQDEADNESEGGRAYTGWVLFAVAGTILAIGTAQVLSSNAEREAQARRVKEAQAKMEVLS
jgi:hypothetical protein